MQLHLHLRPVFLDGSSESVDLFLTLSEIPDDSGGSKQLVPPIKYGGADTSKDTELTRQNAAGRPVSITAIPGLKYRQNSLSVQAGEQIALTLENNDQMPHNWVLVERGAYQEVGELSEQMINQPDAIDRAYVPDSPRILAHTEVVQGGQSTTLSFTAPNAPGAYVYFCTYPGHWKVMRGTLIVY